MGIFDSLFGKGKEDKVEVRDASQKVPDAMSWQQLTTIEQLDAIEEQSQSVPVVIFKHSTTCGVSRMAIKQFESEYDFAPSQLVAYYLDLKAYRDVSNEIANRFKVHHQSPQVILIKNGAAVYDESHGSISAGEIGAKL
ncbi:bacillithiol system redox-active protein YtxJ [Dokdonia sinensis]|uniref:Bacillithiol system redox-active protein YtxJ n=1 Tax=Dokdonia sinensis TaxID=2479847 RepID=A0A3M0G627_9FLAO|nr:bacillithiol system redox-active protein YtxJ [Dokdonia sinensis]RMB60491.1 bacillithiol system redox-active protein YtxJ [Dokdonia sinensis]